MTRSNNVDALESFLTHEVTKHPVHVIGVDLTESARRIKRVTGMFGFYWYYDRWQKLAGTIARALHAQINFDLIHHVTIATYWQRSIVGVIDVPSVLGPVGGGPSTPWRLLPELGPKGAMVDLLRLVTQRLWSRRTPVRTALQRSSVILAQNPETAKRIERHHRAVVAPNGSAGSIEEVEEVESDSVVVVGRLIPYKAGALAMKAFAHSEANRSRLIFVGDGPERRRLERLAIKLDLTDRVEFLGNVPRREALTQIAGARALLHPALHEDSGMTVAEALTLGTPVICLRIGGPPVLCALWPDDLSQIVRPTTPSRTVHDLASAISRATTGPRLGKATPIPPRQTFQEQVLDAYWAALNER